MKDEHLLGGQAVIEGVMMKGKRFYAVAVRTPRGKVKTRISRIRQLQIQKWPVVRGVVILIQMLVIGMKALMWSAEQQLEEEEKISTLGIIVMVLLSFGFAFLLFKLIPLGLTKIIFLHRERQFGFNVVDGLIRIGVFLLYVLVISRFKDIRRIFEYHGAEHKTVHCYESGKKLTVKNVMRHSQKHPRCGTSFILIVLIVSILVFSLVDVKLPFHSLLLYRLPLILPIAGISYELLRISFRFRKKPLFKILIWPGVMLQRLTTRQPDARQIAVAIASAKAIIKKETKII